MFYPDYRSDMCRNLTCVPYVFNGCQCIGDRRKSYTFYRVKVTNSKYKDFLKGYPRRGSVMSSVAVQTRLPDITASQARIANCYRIIPKEILFIGLDHNIRLLHAVGLKLIVC